MTSKTSPRPISDRLAAAITNERAQRPAVGDRPAQVNTWNYWPDALAVVAIGTVSDPLALFEMGQLYGAEGQPGQVYLDSLPIEVRKVLRENRQTNGRAWQTTLNVRYVRHDRTGNGGNHRGEKNLLAIFPPTQKWEHPHGTRGAYVMDAPAVAVEIGCAHQWVTKTLGNCYYEHRCTVCGYTYNIDSGD